MDTLFLSRYVVEDRYYKLICNCSRIICIRM